MDIHCHFAATVHTCLGVACSSLRRWLLFVGGNSLHLVTGMDCLPEPEPRFFQKASDVFSPLFKEPMIAQAVQCAEEVGAKCRWVEVAHRRHTWHCKNFLAKAPNRVVDEA